MAPPSESELLTDYLVRRAGLPAVTTMAQFEALFPRAVRQQRQRQVRGLYRELQAQRSARVVDAVAANVEAEARRGAAMRREVWRRRGRRGDDDDDDDDDSEVGVERALFGAVVGGGSDDGGAAAAAAAHSLRSVVPELEGAAEALESEIGRLRDEEAVLAASVGQTVGGLSDLRYGRLANATLRDEVLDGLESLQRACDGKS